MLKKYLSLSLLALLLAACMQSAPVADVPEDIDLETAAATSIFSKPYYESFWSWQDPRMTFGIITTDGPLKSTGKPAFTKAFQFTTTGPFEQPYNLTLYAFRKNDYAIAKDDVLLVQFWGRATGASTTAQTEFAFENDTTYEKSVAIGATFGRSWKFYRVAFKAKSDFPQGRASINFRLGYANQSFELGGISVLNYGKTRTVTSIPSRGFEYPGIETDAAWRQAANTRIDQLRKGNLNVRVVDASGAAVSGASVKIEMQQHAFPFGSEIDAPTLFSNSTYQQKALQLFNRVVPGNSLKWGSWECCERNVGLQMLDFFNSRGISVRGHNVIWPAEYFMPEDVKNLVYQGDKTTLRQRIETRMVDVMTATKGKVVEWDVINEPSYNKFVTNLLGEDEMAAWLRRAKQLDPNARLFINDYDNLGEGTLDVEYKRILQRMQALGAPLEGIGLQGHFAWDLTPPEELHQRLNDFGKFGVPLAITEFDINISDEGLQAKYLRDTMTIAFANPHVSSFIIWGFWEGKHWLPQGALYRTDWSIKPSGQVWSDLIFKQWWTNVTGTSSSSGTYGTRGFLGKYKISVTKDGKTAVSYATLTKSGSNVTVTLR